LDNVSSKVAHVAVALRRAPLDFFSYIAHGILTGLGGAAAGGITHRLPNLIGHNLGRLAPEVEPQRWDVRGSQMSGRRSA
jgi:hypothetical protein